MGIHKNKSTVERFDQLTAACDLDALDEICTPDMINHALASHRRGGLEGTKQFLRECRSDQGKAAWMRAMMSGQQLVTIAEGDYLIQLGTRTARWPGGHFRGFDIPAGDYEYDVAFMYRFESERIAERWAVRDDLAMIQQLSGNPVGPDDSPPPRATAEARSTIEGRIMSVTEHPTTPEAIATGGTHNTDPVAAVSEAKREDAHAAVAAAERAFPGWAATAPAERCTLLERASELLMERQRDIATLVTEETGGTLGWGMFNVQLGAGMLAYYAHQTGAPAEDQEIPSHIPGKRARAVRQPVGVVVGIAPWNTPVVLGVRAVAAPLAYGNTVVLKASEQCPRTHAAIVDALRDAGVPEGAINLVTNDPADAAEVVDELIAHPAVRRINFTGSTRVGRIVAEKAARHLKRVLLELGGNAPLVVLADADLERAVAAASFGAFMHQGQICMSTQRIVIDRSVADEFAQRLAERAKALKLGDPREPDTQIGPLVNEDAIRRVTEHVEDAVAKGAKVLTGGNTVGNSFEPTVLMGVTPEMRVYSAESFGPVVAIIPVDGIDEAVRVANDTEYGLSAAVFSADVDAAMDIARRLDTGVCHINDATVNDEPPMPFGGVKHSGWGRFGGKAALEEFTELRWITIQDSPRQYPI